MKKIECLQRAVDYMEENICHTMTVAQIAEYAYLSERTLAELFSSFAGMTVMEYVRQRRLTMAAQDVLAIKEKMIDLSYRYCYESQDSFSRAFRRFHGCSPQQLRSSGRQPKVVQKIQFTNQHLIGETESHGYRVIENGPVYYTDDMDSIVNWFREILGWVANIDARNETGEGIYGCAMPISDGMVSDHLTTFLGLNFFYGEPIQKVVGYLTVDCVECVRETILKHGWTKVSEIESFAWGAKEFSVTTPDGSILRFSSYDSI